jgi:hypothetical protein
MKDIVYMQTDKGIPIHVDIAHHSNSSRRLGLAVSSGYIKRSTQYGRSYM